MSKQSAITRSTNKRNTRRGRVIDPNPTIQTPEWHHWQPFVRIIVNPVHISHPAAVSHVDSE